VSELPAPLVEVVRSFLVAGEIVSVEGPNGVGKSTLLERLRDAVPGFEIFVGPRPYEDEKRSLRSAHGLQFRSECWLVELLRLGVPGFLDRGWISIDVYRRLYARPDPSPSYATWFPEGVPARGLVVFVESDDATIDSSIEARGGEYLERFDLVAERGLFRRAANSYGGAAIVVRRDSDGGYLVSVYRPRR